MRRRTSETNDNRHAQVELRGGVDDPLGNDVAAHDAAKDVDQDAVDLPRVGVS